MSQGKMRGHIGSGGHCSVPGHGHDHMRGAPSGYVCEVTNEIGQLGAKAERRRVAAEIEAELAE